MASITATTSATPSAQAALVKARLEQARREADQAEDKAQTLRSQADAAEVEARRDKDKVGDLTTRARQIDATYASPLKAKDALVPMKTQDFLVRMYAATSGKFAASGNALKTLADSAPVINAQGQSTGRIVNISA